jgi:hypothetical protein
LDSSPGAIISVNGEEAKVFGSRPFASSVPAAGTEVTVEGMSKPGIVHSDGLILFGSDGSMVSQTYLEKLQFIKLVYLCFSYSLLPLLVQS